MGGSGRQWEQRSAIHRSAIGDAVTAQKRHLVRLPAVRRPSALVIGGHHTRCFARRGLSSFSLVTRSLKHAYAAFVAHCCAQEYSSVDVVRVQKEEASESGETTDSGEVAR